MIKKQKAISLIGAGNMSNELIPWIRQSGYIIDYIYDDNSKLDYSQEIIIKNQIFQNLQYIIAVGYPQIKQKIISNIKQEIKWASPVIHPSVVIGGLTYIGLGSIIGPYVVLTYDIMIEELATINTHVTIGHNVIIGKMFHASAGSTVSGNVIIGDRVFMGANAVIKEKINICSDVIIGAGAVVVKDIIKSGKYAGNPAKKINEGTIYINDPRR